MSKVNVLDSSVANMIAAGEVVENPASVVKELIENAIDAKGSAVTVEIQNGGITYIRVTDDGMGMEPTDAKTAFLRHATSKISNASDLEGISTLGFRGEALAAISSVSKIDLITKTHESNIGVALRVEAGKVVRESESGCPDGTTIIVRELFYNTPARMRFLKKDATEAAMVESVVKSAALSHPEVSVKFIKDGRDILHTPGDGVVKNCIYALFGRDFANNMIDVELAERGMRVCGYVSAPQGSRGNRSMQFFFVNGRPIKSRMLAVALDNAYKERIMKGRFPTCVLMMDIPLGQVDVNVHPAKTEVKFSRERDVFDIVYYGAKSALESKEKRVVPPPAAPKLPPVDTVTENQTRLESVMPKREEKPTFVPPEMPRFERKNETVLRSPIAKPSFLQIEPEPIEEEKQEPKAEKAIGRDESFVERVIPREEPITQTVTEKSAKAEETVLKEEIADIGEAETQKEEKEIELRYVGEIMKTYIVVEGADSMYLIDKHAAHERIIFEKIVKNRGEIQTQLLLTPEIISIDAKGAMAILENREELSRIGFEVDDFGNGSVVLSAVPDGIDAYDAVAVLEGLAEVLKTGARASLPDVMSETMYSVACKAAMKAGQRNSPEELMAIAKRVLCEDDIRYCPHGRPVMIEITKTELEKMFKRIV